jgi:hypothetical protein
MREIRTSGSEGGGIEANRFSLPLSSRRLDRWTPAFAGEACMSAAVAKSIVSS